MAALGALCTMIASALLGQDALKNLYYEGWGTLTGRIYYLTEFKELTASLYMEALTGYAGMGDDRGYPLTDDSAAALSREAEEAFYDTVSLYDKDLLYYVKKDGNRMKSGKEAGNISYPLFSEYDGHLLLPEDAVLLCCWNGSESRLNFFSGTSSSPLGISPRLYKGPYYPNGEDAASVRLVIALKEDSDYASQTLSRMQKTADSYRLILWIFLGSAALFCFSLFLSLFSSASARKAAASYAVFAGRIRLEWKLLLFLLCFLYIHNVLYSLTDWILAYPSLWICFVMGCLLYLFLMDLVHNRSALWKHSYIGGFFRFLQNYVNGVSWYRKALNLCIAIWGCALLLVCSGCFLLFYGEYILITLTDRGFSTAVDLTPFIPACFLMSLLLFATGILQYRFLKDASAISGKLAALKNGNAGAPLQFSGHSLLKEAASDLNEVESGIENAVEQRDRSNRMRVELITNVSHDLKTPLTSIINYADLLCEENLPDPASEYARSLQAKAYRLKGMVQDVFDLSKATSGNLPLEKTRLDLAKLIRQTLADMDERISESTLTVRLSIADEPIMIEADGEKLYRVFQNLMVNALQYSLENSRVHIRLACEEGFAYAKIKNTSRDELSFDPDEIVERFVRADSSRTTEGSGLGLSIARSFTENCGGTFSVEIDADMFTACVCFPLSEDRSN